MRRAGPLFPDRFLSINGQRVHFLDQGAGPAVVMMHGNPTWSYYYRSLVERLRDRFRVIVPDHVGCGLSDKPPAADYPYTLRRRVEDLEALLDELKVPGPFSLVVHDWGGMIGMAYATKYPDRIGRLVVMNTAAFHLPRGMRLPWQLWLVRNTPLGSLLVRGLNLFVRGTVRLSRALSPDERAQYVAPYDSWENRIAVLRFVQDIPLTPSDPSYADVSAVQERLRLLRAIPKLICWGERDFVFTPRFLEEWIRWFPDATVHRFPDAGHLILEDERERIGELVDAFLERPA